MQRNKEEGKRFVIGVTGLHALRLAGIFIAGFLIGKVNISSTIYPFGAAFLLSAFLVPGQINPYMASGGVLLAMATSAGNMDNPAYHFAVIAIITALMILGMCLKFKPNLGIAAIVAIAAYTICTVAFKLSYLMSVLSSVIELVITLLMTMVISQVFKLIGYKGRRKVLTDEEMISLCFCGLVCVMGLGNIGISGVYIREIAASYIVILAGFAGGAAMGTAAGVATALACVIAGTQPAYVGVLGLTGMAAGSCKSFGKIATGVGAVIANLFGALYICYGNISTGSIIAFGLAIIGFLFTPKAWTDRFQQYMDLNVLRMNEWRLKEERFREMTVGRLNEISTVFRNAATVFQDSTARLESDSISYTMAAIPETACDGCVFYKNCWDENFENTYELMQRLYQKYVDTGRIRMKDMGKFGKKCIHSDALLFAAKETFEKYETNRKWEGKIAKSRSLIGEQMHGVSRVIDSLTSEVQVDMSFRKDYENQIRISADAAGIDLKETSVLIMGGTIHVDLIVRSNRIETIEEKLTELVSNACELAMKQVAMPKPCGKKLYMLKYEQAHAFDVETGVAMMTKEGSPISGDTHSREALKDGRYMMLLCDGMGSGERAAKESRTAVSLMEDFYRAEFDDKMVLDAINKLLILSSSDEIFSTMDIVMLDLIEGTAKFTKIGAPHSYIINESGMRKLHAGSLPIGILEDYEPIVHETTLEPGDTIVMFTDGIADLESVDDEFYEAIRESAKLRNANEIAERILTHALAAYGGIAKDDMTVMVGRIVK